MVIQNTWRTLTGKHVSCVNKFKFATSVDPVKCLEEIKLPSSLYTCAPMSKLPTNIGNMA